MSREMNTHINTHKYTHTPNSKYSLIPMFTTYPHECQCDDPQPPPHPRSAACLPLQNQKTQHMASHEADEAGACFDLFVHTNFFPQISYIASIWWLWSQMNFWILWTLSTKECFLPGNVTHFQWYLYVVNKNKSIWQFIKSSGQVIAEFCTIRMGGIKQL